MAKDYFTYSFSGDIDWSVVPEESLDFSNWDSEADYNTYFQMCFKKNDGIYVKMRTDETDIRAVYHENDDPVWQDSCMEFFVCAVEGRDEYINFEMNSNSVYLSEFGKDKKSRVFLKTVTDIKADVTADVSDKGWNVELFVPCELIREAYGTDFEAGECKIRFNFYKCGDNCNKKHYHSYTKMTTLPPGFHNPGCFAFAHIKER